jgi:hypothetical protein
MRVSLLSAIFQTSRVSNITSIFGPFYPSKEWHIMPYYCLNYGRRQVTTLLMKALSSMYIASIAICTIKTLHLHASASFPISIRPHVAAQVTCRFRYNVAHRTKSDAPHARSVTFFRERQFNFVWQDIGRIFTHCDPSTFAGTYGNMNQHCNPPTVGLVANQLRETNSRV